MEDLIQELKRKKVLKSARIAAALREVDRADFVPENLMEFAYVDDALPIGRGQTISQPYTVVFMLELLDAAPGQKIMEIGYGSGWQTALLAHLVAPAGEIYAFELVPELCEMGEKNVSKYPEIMKRVALQCENASSGLPEIAKKIGGFDRIICAADIEKIPASWRTELKDGGILVYPSGSSIFREIKKGASWKKEEFPGFAFVPFIEP